MSIFIAAEIGINHNGSMETCKKLIDLAADTGCNAVKFQKRTLIKFILTNSYQKKETVHGVILRGIKKMD